MVDRVLGSLSTDLWETWIAPRASPALMVQESVEPSRWKKTSLGICAFTQNENKNSKEQRKNRTLHLSHACLRIREEDVCTVPDMY